ncbi:MAG: hypothetical protein PF481_09660 [Bacteroidales bacterium]|jgi:hypothetical protein|nr:hypothetical protein [Bacteroidales bacterium]
MYFKLTGIDIIITVIALIVVFVYANNVQQKYISRYSHFKYLKLGLFARIFAGMFFTYIYLVFYGGGDTVYYFSGAGSIAKVALKDFTGFIRLLFGEQTAELYSLFDWKTGYPTYYRDPNAYSVCRFMVPFYIMGFGSYWATTVIMNAVLFIPIWKFYTMMCSIYPRIQKEMAISLLFFPSLVFWSSGILKDVWCLVALLVLYRHVWLIVVKKRKKLKSIFILIFWTYILISIRPFMYYTAFVTILLWLGLRVVRNIESVVFRTIVFPVIMIFGALIIIFTITRLGSVAEGKYATVDSMMEHAVIIQDDLSREAYGENSFDIGDFDASASSMLSKAPVAIVAGLFRPFFWEAGSILMIFTGLESLFFMSLFLYLIVKSGGLKFFTTVYQDPMLMSFFVFSIMFAFFVGLTTANFGALVRYKIALLPFFNIVLFRMKYVLNTK